MPKTMAQFCIMRNVPVNFLVSTALITIHGSAVFPCSRTDLRSVLSLRTSCPWKTQGQGQVEVTVKT